MLKDALEFYQDFLKAHGSDPAVRFEAARTAHRVGSIQELLGHFDKVEAPLKQAIGLLDRLIADSPHEEAYRVEWAECNSDLGQVYGLSLGPPKGIQYRRNALAEYEKLVKKHPENAIYRRRLASRQCNLGLSLSTQSQNQFEEAEQHLRGALKKWKQIEADSPCRSEDQLELARMHHWLGNLLMQTSRWAEAESELNSALAIQENLLAANKHDPNIASRFAHTKSYLVGLMLNQRKLKEAERLQREAIALLLPLVTAYPDVIYYTRRLGLDYVSLASTLWALGDHRNADMEFRKALTTAERMVKDHPDAHDYPKTLAFALYHQGLFLDEWNRPEESAESLRRASQLYEDLVTRFPSDLRNQANLARFLAFCPAPQFRDDARTIELAKQLLRQRPSVAEYWYLLGVALYRGENWTVAAEALEKAIELDPTYPHPALFLAMTNLRQGNKEQAKSHYERVARLIDENHYADMESRHFQRDAAALLGMKPPEVKDMSAK